MKKICIKCLIAKEKSEYKDGRFKTCNNCLSPNESKKERQRRYYEKWRKGGGKQTNNKRQLTYHDRQFEKIKVKRLETSFMIEVIEKIAQQSGIAKFKMTKELGLRHVKPSSNYTGLLPVYLYAIARYGNDEDKKLLENFF